jgi:urease accessory protein
VQARATLVAEHVGGGVRFSTMRSDPPLTLRAGEPNTVNLVGSAAGPVGGDQLELDVTIGPHAHVTMRSVAAMIVYPSPVPSPSRLDVRIAVDSGAHLLWAPEPTVLVNGCDHYTNIDISLAETASLIWIDEVMLGRWNESSGSLMQRLRIDRGGRPLLRADLAIGPRWPASDGPAGIDEASALATVVVVGPAARWLAIRVNEVRAAVMPLGEDAVSCSLLSTRSAPLRKAVAALADMSRARSPSRSGAAGL